MNQAVDERTDEYPYGFSLRKRPSSVTLLYNANMMCTRDAGRSRTSMVLFRDRRGNDKPSVADCGGVGFGKGLALTVAVRWDEAVGCGPGALLSLSRTEYLFSRLAM